MFIKLKPQKVQHLFKRYIVQSNGKYYMKYIDSDYIANVRVNSCPEYTIIIKNKIVDENDNKINSDDSNLIAKRVAKGLKAMGVATVIIE